MLNINKQATEIETHIPLLKDKLEPICEQYAIDSTLLITEMIKFLNLIHISKQRLSPSYIVDLAWHEFILFTRYYHEFCQQYYGRYIHHTPSKSENPNIYKKTIQHYIVNYNEPPESIWGQAALEEWETSNCGSCHN